MGVKHPGGLTSVVFVCVADFIHKITVQASPGLEKRRNSPDLGSGSSPSFGPRFRAIQRERTYTHTQTCTGTQALIPVPVSASRDSRISFVLESMQGLS